MLNQCLTSKINLEDCSKSLSLVDLYRLQFKFFYDFKIKKTITTFLLNGLLDSKWYKVLYTSFTFSSS